VVSLLGFVFVFKVMLLFRLAFVSARYCGLAVVLQLDQLGFVWFWFWFWFWFGFGLVGLNVWLSFVNGNLLLDCLPKIGIPSPFDPLCIAIRSPLHRNSIPIASQFDPLCIAIRSPFDPH
jgi:hypothetical protein